MTKRNGRSSFRCPACHAELGHVRRTALLLLRFVSTPAVVKVEYRQGGDLFVTCRCGRVTQLPWR